MDFTISKSTEEEVRSYLRDNYKQFNSDFALTSENTNYSHKLFSKSTRYEIWKNSELVGMLCVYFNRSLGQAYIPYLCVSENMKHMGLGTNLLDILLTDINKHYKYVKSIVLEVSISNVLAQEFYKKNSFVEISRNTLKIQLYKLI